MRFRIDPEARSGLIRMSLASGLLATASAVLLASTSLLLSPSWLAKSVTVIGIMLGFLVSLLIYYVWGSASFLVDCFVWATSLLTIFLNATIQYTFCSLSSNIGYSSPICAYENQYAAIYGGMLAVLAGTLPAWMTIRYITWRMRKNS